MSTDTCEPEPQTKFGIAMHRIPEERLRPPSSWWIIQRRRTHQDRHTPRTVLGSSGGTRTPPPPPQHTDPNTHLPAETREVLGTFHAQRCPGTQRSTCARKLTNEVSSKYLGLYLLRTATKEPAGPKPAIPKAAELPPATNSNVQKRGI